MDVPKCRLSRSQIPVRTTENMAVPATPAVQAADVTIFINNKDRLTSTRALTEWLLRAGTKKITILDNASTYPPLLEWYKGLPEGVTVEMGPNRGPWGAWSTGRLQTQGNPYVVTDSDLVPANCCPLDLIR